MTIEGIVYLGGVALVFRPVAGNLAWALKKSHHEKPDADAWGGAIMLSFFICWVWPALLLYFVASLFPKVGIERQAEKALQAKHDKKRIRELEQELKLR